MASLRKVRKAFRKDVLRLIAAGEGSTSKLVEFAARHFGHDVGYEIVLETFRTSEVSNAVSYLRNEGLIETVGKQWKPVADLESEDKDLIMNRRDKRVRGELKAQIRMAHDTGNTERAFAAAEMLKTLSDSVSPTEAEKEPSSSATRRAELAAIVAEATTA